jgi:hypothetical protein
MMNNPLYALRQALVGLTSLKRNGTPRRADKYRRSLSYESLESRDLLAVVTLANMSVSEDTADKPQSKVWEHAGQWWSVMPNSDGTWVWRLDGTSWTPTLQLTDNDAFHADVKSTGDVAHVLLFDGDQSQLASIEYVGGAAGYQMWTQRPQLVGVPMGSSTETATIDIDSLGRMWTAFDSGSSVQVRYSDLSSQYSTWSNAITLGSLGSDDITSIIAMPGGSIGVLWSDQGDERFGFRVHADGADPANWSQNEVPASQSARNVGGGMADDHLNIKVASNGTIYAAVKTSYDSSGEARMALLVRRPNGVWDNMYTVDTSASTRPIVLLNEAANRLIVAFTTSESGGNIVYRESRMDTISFGSRQTMISGTVNNVTSTKQNFIDNVVLLAAGGSSARGALFSFDNIVVNAAPIVDAGSGSTINFGGTAVLNASVSDDNLPAPPNLVTSWSEFSGPGNVIFASPSSIDTTATFTTAGTYVLRLTASDGERSSFDEVTVIVNDPPGGGDPNPDPDPGPSGNEPTELAFQDGLFPSLSYAGTRDTYLNSKSTGANFGTANTLLIDGSPDYATLLKWDVSAIPTGSVVTSAAIELYVTDTSSGAYEVYALQRAWDELSATWQQYAAGLNWASAGANSTADHGSAVLGTVSPSNTGTLRIALSAAGIAAVQAWVNDPAANHGVLIQDYGVSSGADFNSSETATASQRPKLIIGYEPASGNTDPPPNDDPTNAAPSVDAGPNRSVAFGVAASLDGTVSDDSQPAPPSLTTTWSKVSGPGTVTFGNPSSVDTSANFSLAGTYVLRLTVSDGELSAFDEMTVTVGSENMAPLVNAGPNRTITLGESAALDGTVSDDNLPAPPNLITAWSQVAGPGTVSFASASSVDTSANFSEAGTYTLRLSASDGVLSAFDDMTVVVQAPAQQDPGQSGEPTQLAFQDGLFPSLSYAGTRDTYISSKSTNTNYGNFTEIWIDGSPDYATLLKWDVSAVPAGSIVNSATIELNVTNTSSGTYEVYSLQRAWDELSATWQQYAAGQNWATAGASNTADRSSTVLGSVAPSNMGTYVITLNAAGVAAVQAWVNNPAANHGVLIQDYGISSGADFLSSETPNATQRPKLVINYQPPATLAALAAFGAGNEAPVVNVGPDRTIALGSQLTLQGAVNDDDLPFGPGAITVQWTKQSGPGVVTFASDTSFNTTAQFSSIGAYVLRLTAFDGDLVSFDELTVNVVPAI